MRFWILTRQETKALAVVMGLAVAGALGWAFLPPAPRAVPQRLAPFEPPAKKAPSKSVSGRK